MTQRLDFMHVAPNASKALGAVYGYVSQAGLGKALVDLAYLRASQINGCAYCIDSHTVNLLKAGADPAKIALLPVWRETPGAFTDQERAALAWTEALTRVSHSHVSDDDYEAATSVFSEKELADLTVAIGLINVYNRLGVAFRKTPESLARLEAARG